jgi:hypothetical protein
MKNEHAALTYKMDKQHVNSAFVFSVLFHFYINFYVRVHVNVHATCSCRVSMLHVQYMQHEHAVWTCSGDTKRSYALCQKKWTRSIETMDKKNGHAALACRTNM